MLGYSENGLDAFTDDAGGGFENFAEVAQQQDQSYSFSSTYQDEATQKQLSSRYYESWKARHNGDSSGDESDTERDSRSQRRNEELEDNPGRPAIVENRNKDVTNSQSVTGPQSQKSYPATTAPPSKSHLKTPSGPPTHGAAVSDRRRDGNAARHVHSHDNRRAPFSHYPSQGAGGAPHRLGTCVMAVIPVAYA